MRRKDKCTMRSVTKRLAIGLVAVFALTAVTAASASASPEWYAKKAGVWGKITTPVKFTAESKYEMTDTKNKIGVEVLTISCKATTNGVVGAGAAGKINEIKVEASGCKCVSGCTAVEKYELRNFYW